MSRPRRPSRVVDGALHLSCARCTAWLPETAFRIDRAAAFGRKSWCSACHSTHRAPEVQRAKPAHCHVCERLTRGRDSLGRVCCPGAHLCSPPRVSLQTSAPVLGRDGYEHPLDGATTIAVAGP